MVRFMRSVCSSVAVTGSDRSWLLIKARLCGGGASALDGQERVLE